MKPKRVEDLGFDRNQIEYLTRMSQEMFAPDSFDEEVQFWLNKLNEEGDEKKRISRP
jgi:hypothetical protein